MTDRTITLSYEERSRLLIFLSMAHPEVAARYPEYLETLRTIMQRVARLDAGTAQAEDDWEQCPRCARLAPVGETPQWPYCNCY
jgi:hypothetical protein